MTDIAQPAGIGTLSAAQVEQFHKDGFLSPLTACTTGEMADFQHHVEQVIGHRIEHGQNESLNLHLHNRTIFNMVTLPTIVGAIQSIMGEDLLLWRSNFLTKNPGEREIPWHQDHSYWPLEPEIIMSAWVAIDPATIENSAMQMIPGSHRKIIPHIPVSKTLYFSKFEKMADPAGIDLSKKVDVELMPGQFCVFNERTLHHSEVNRSAKRRMALVIRVIIPQVRILRYDAPDHKVIQISGSDKMGFNQHTNAPTEKTA